MSYSSDQLSASDVPGYEDDTRGSGFVAFAGIVMILTGVMQSLWGLAAIVDDELFVVGQKYLYRFDTTTWGWIHLVLGLVVLGAGFAVFRGSLWARSIGVLMAFLSAVGAFLNLPSYPFWGIVVLTLDVFVIWALIAHGRVFATARGAV